MKYLLLALTLITLTFLSCSKSEDDTPQTPDTTLYEGTWRGELSPVTPGSVNTTWIMYVKGDGTVSQEHDNVFGFGVGSGSVTEDGQLKLSYNGGGIETGTFNAEMGYYTGYATHGSLEATSFGTKD